MDKLVRALTTVVLMLGAGLLPALAAQGEIEIGPRNVKDAVIIPRVTVDGNDVQFGQNGPPGGPGVPVTPFEASEDWPLKTDIYIFNRTNKVIVAGRVSLAFLRTGAESGPPRTEMNSGLPIPTVHADFGIIPEDTRLSNGQVFPHRAGESRVEVQPGGMVVIHVGDYADAVARSLKQMGRSHAPARLFIIPGTFYFDDGMRWAGNRYSTPDPEHPGKWISEDAEYFPGNRWDNWPVPGHRWTPSGK